jgi:hypothetical protein
MGEFVKDQQPEKPVITWVHRDGTTIAVYPDRKTRHGYTMPDQWPVLYRSSVPELDDAMWYASPGEGWSKQPRVN